jgi:hypothetical protein
VKPILIVLCGEMQMEVELGCQVEHGSLIIGRDNCKGKKKRKGEGDDQLQK